MIDEPLVQIKDSVVMLKISEDRDLPRRNQFGSEPTNTKQKITKAILDIITVVFIDMLDQMEKKNHKQSESKIYVNIKEATEYVLSKKECCLKISEINTEMLYNVNIETAYSYILKRYYKFFIDIKDPRKLFQYYLIRVCFLCLKLGFTMQ